MRSGIRAPNRLIETCADNPTTQNKDGAYGHFTQLQSFSRLLLSLSHEMFVR